MSRKKFKQQVVLNDSLDDSDGGYVTSEEQQQSEKVELLSRDDVGRYSARNVATTSAQLIKGYRGVTYDEPVTSATPLSPSVAKKRIVYTKQLLRRYMLWVLSGWLLLVVMSVIILYGWRVAYDVIEDQNNSFLDDDFDETDKTDLYYITTNCTAGNDFDITLKRSGYAPLPYFPKNGSAVLSYALLKAYGAVAEPYAPMQLHVFGDDSVDKHGADYYFKYTLYDGAYSPVAHAAAWPSEGYQGSLQVECDPYDEYRLAVLKYGLDGRIRGGAIEDVLCLYVRREVRELSADDLAASLDAMHALWEYSDEEGQVEFGEDFYSSNYFAEAHNFNAAWKDADHIHEGLGFVPQHIKISNWFERAMQSVDPSVSLFYWDYTIETANEESVFDSYIFTEDIFGELNEPEDMDFGWLYGSDDIDDARIKNGRWKDLKAEYSVRYPELQSGYGYMRGPWNMNPSSYVSRFSTTAQDLPGCKSFVTWISESDWSSFMQISPYGPHSTTHAAIGGQYGCDVLDTMRDSGYIETQADQAAICQKWGFYMKELYRGDYISLGEDCSIEAQDCVFTCNDDRLDDLLDTLKDTLKISNYLPADIDEDDWLVWRDFICSDESAKLFVGDHLESASPADPSFWPIHPTGERLYQAKLLAGGFDEYSWPTLDSDKGYICNHQSCYEFDGFEKDYYDGCCYGHYEFDQLLDFTIGNKSSGIGQTNSQALSDTDASSGDYAMPYIYAHFEWTHCDEDFEALAAELKEDMDERRKR